VNLRTGVERYLAAHSLVEQKKLLSELPLASASPDLKRAVAQELVEKADSLSRGWVSENRLGIALRALGEAGDQRVPEITSRLRTHFTEESDYSSESIDLLSGMLRALGPRAKAAVPVLEEALGGPFATTAATTLAAIDPTSPKLDRWLEKTLESKDEAVLYAAAGVLDALDLPDRHLSRVFDLALRSGVTPIEVRGQFLHVLLREGIERRLSEEQIAEIIRFVLANAEEFAPYFSGETLLPAFPARIAEHEERILDLTGSRSSSVRGTAAYLLGRIEPASPISVQRLYEMAEDREEYVGRDAVMALLKLGRFDLVAAGIETRSDVYRFSVTQAVDALKKILEVDPRRLPPRAQDASWQAKLSEISNRNGMRPANLDPTRPTVPPAWRESGCGRAVETVPACSALLEAFGPQYIDSGLVTEDGSVLLWVLGGKTLLKLTPDLRYDARYSCEANYALGLYGLGFEIDAMIEVGGGRVLVSARRRGNGPVAGGTALDLLTEEGRADERFRANAPFPMAFGNYPALAVDGEGRVYAGGQPVAFGKERPRNLVRLLPDGRLDTAFPTDLLEVPGLVAAGHGIHQIVPLDDGRVFLTGNLRELQREPYELDWLILTPEGSPDTDIEWEDPMRFLGEREHFRFAFPGADRGLFVTRVQDSSYRVSVAKVWLKGEVSRAQPEIVLSNSPPGAREAPSPSLSSLDESEGGDVLVAGVFTHVAVGGLEHPSSGLALIRGGNLHVNFLKNVGLERAASHDSEVLDARILTSEEIVFIGRSSSPDRQRETFTISRLSPEGRALHTCQATFDRD
jgi:hypothetical protein